MKKQFKFGDKVDLPAETKVFVDYGNTISFKGIIVGKSTTDITQCHIVKCTDGTLPNETYPYDTVTSPLQCLTVLD